MHRLLGANYGKTCSCPRLGERKKGPISETRGPTPRRRSCATERAANRVHREARNLNLRLASRAVNAAKVAGRNTTFVVGPKAPPPDNSETIPGKPVLVLAAGKGEPRKPQSEVNSVYNRRQCDRRLPFWMSSVAGFPCPAAVAGSSAPSGCWHPCAWS